MPRRENGHRKARQIYPEIGQCEGEGCNRKAVDRHHVDGNTFNNDRSNVKFLCRACHMEADGRMDALRDNGSPKQPPKLCANCGELSKPLRRGRCHKCNEYLRRHGIERPYSGDGRKEKTIALQEAPCLRCGRPANIVGRPMKGYCGSCYTYFWRKQKRERLENE